MAKKAGKKKVKVVKVGKKMKKGKIDASRPAAKPPLELWPNQADRELELLTKGKQKRY